MISRETIANVLDRADILEVVSEFVKLQKAGKDYKGLSPFTDEKKPSFYVVPAKGIFKDFSSGKGGSAVTFLMELEKLSFPEAIRWLAKKYDITLEDKEPEDPEQDHMRELIFEMNGIASRFFSSQLYHPDNSRILEYIKSRFSDDDIVSWQIGIAPDKWTGFQDECITQCWAETASLLKSNLVREKNGKTFDYFRNRVIFPIENAVGNICGFGGRALPWDKEDQAKYINSPDSAVYNKSRLLFGLSRARKEISRLDVCHLVEGYADVVAMHAAGVINTVAPCGTALTEEQILQIKKLCRKINMIYDADTAGFNATLRSAELILRAGVAAYVTRLPDGEDPGSFIKEDTTSYIATNQQSFISWRAKSLLEGTGEDPLARHNALKEIVRYLSLISDRALRDIFVEDLCKKNRIQRKTVKDLLDESTGDGSVSSDDLPGDVDAREFERWGFYDYKNEYYFRTKDDIVKMSNFVMKPLFHVESAVDTRRIYELTNYKGFRVVVDFDMQEMTSLQAFRKNVEGRGNYLFWGTDIQFGKLKLKLYEETKTCMEIKNLGWQKEGFWAWSNGIIMPDGSFLPVDEYGIVEFANNHYFIPAFSKIYLNDRSIFIDERKFKFKTREVSLRQWCDQFFLVFGDNAKVGIAFWIASIFRDYILHIFKNFPLLNLFGPKGTGKSQMAMSLSCLFGQGQTPFNIHNGTKPGLAEHIQQFINALAWVDEYKNSLEYDKIETLKSIYDSIGRSRMNLDKGKKKETTLVNSAVILSGQEMPTADVALFSRMIFCRFHKTSFDDAEKQHYDRLKAMENEGLSHLTSLIVPMREYFEKNFYKNYDNTLTDLSQFFANDKIEDRIIRNFSTIVAAFRTLEDKFDFGFTYDDLNFLAKSFVLVQNNQVYSSNEVSIFWNILEAMFDDNIIEDQWHFKIKYTDTITTNKGDIFFGNGNAKNILKFKLNIIIKLYSEHAKKMGVKPLPADTIKYYLENHDSFVGVEKSCRFTRKEYSQAEGQAIEQKQITSAYCFDYDRLKINLSREAIMTKENTENKDPEDSRQLDMDAMIESTNTEMPF